MVETMETQWIAGLNADDRRDSYTLIHESGAVVAHIQAVGRLWDAFWYDGSYAGLFDELGQAMDAMEKPAPECGGPNCDSIPLAGFAFCSDCLYDTPPNTHLEGK